MLKSMLCAALLAGILTTPLSSYAETADNTPAMQATTTASARGREMVNGIDYYYEVHGEGEPLLLLHGGLGSMDMFLPVLPMLTEGRKVILVDLHGHGRTPLGERTVDPVAIGGDMAALVEALGYEQIDVMGYSFGGFTALNMAAQAPEKITRLVLASSPFKREGFFAEMLPQQAQLSAASAPYMLETPMYQSYQAVAPQPDDFPRLLDEMGTFMRNPYDYSDAVGKLTMPVMLIFGDSDMVTPEHIVEYYQKLGGGLKDAGWQREHMATNRLAILPDITHYEAFMAPIVFRTALSFLNAESGTKSWSDAVSGK